MASVMVVCLPVAHPRITGWPEVQIFTRAEQKAIEMLHLGGLEALRTERYTCACSTVNSLIRKGIMARHGISAYGQHVAETLRAGEMH